jgi:hypothetical protein
MSEPDDVDALPEPGLPVWPKDKSLLPTSGKQGSHRQPRALSRGGVEARRWAQQFTDDPRWERMIWFWIDNPEMMPAGVFSTLLSYRFGKPAQTVKVKGEILARPYLGNTTEEMAMRAKQLADRLAALSDPSSQARLVGGDPSSDATKSLTSHDLRDALANVATDDDD